VLRWLVDHAGLLYVLLGLVALALAVSWWMTRERRYLVGLGAVAGLAALVWLLSLVIVTDRQQIRRAVEEMAQAVADNKPGVIVGHLSKDFSYQGLTRATIEQHLAGTIRAYGLTFVKVWDFDFEQLSRAEGKARVAFRARADLGEDITMWLCRADFVLEDGRWRMKGFNVYNPVVNTDQPIQVPLR
jgi:hypothetical protein